MWQQNGTVAASAAKASSSDEVATARVVRGEGAAEIVLETTDESGLAALAVREHRCNDVGVVDLAVGHAHIG